MDIFKRIYSILLISITLLFGCKKDSTIAVDSITIPRIKTFTTYSGGIPQNTLHYEYNSDGFVSKILENNNNYQTYNYYNNYVYVRYYDFMNTLMLTDTILLNSNSLAIKESYPDKILYTYDSNRFNVLLTSRSISNIDTTTKIMINENKFSETSMLYDSSGILKSTSTIFFQYYPGTINTFDHENFGMKYYGKSSNELVKLIVSKNLSGNFDTLVSYVYELDSLNRVKRQLESNTSAYYEIEYY